MIPFTQPHRYSLTLIAGVATAVALMFFSVPVMRLFYPDWGTRGFVHRGEFGSLFLELFAWLVATYGGGIVAALIAKDYPLLFCAAIGLILSVPLNMNMVADQSPDWFIFACASGMPVAVIAA